MPYILDKLLGEATRLTRGGELQKATAAIQRALGGASSPSAMPVDLARGGGTVLDGLVREIPPPLGRRTEAPRRAGGEPSPRSVPTNRVATPLDGSDSAEDSFVDSTFTGRSGTRAYKLFAPAGFAGKALPLIVMLHGCSQGPDDFAAGTGMNEIAAERGFYVLYPAQAPRSNTSKCWNWFVPGDQRRGSGEPDLLAEMTRHVMQTHPIDPARVYIAGLSAGGAMADIMGREYPDLFAAVGVHSGLPQGAAHDVASAFAAMHSGAGAAPGRVAAGGLGGATASAKTDAAERQSIDGGAPAIVFHGDHDSTVHPSNGERVIGAVLSGANATERVATTREKSAAAGRHVTRSVHRRPGAAAGEPSLAEHWLVHGAGHAWSGGNPAGSYTDAAGPNASREMVRFFEEHPLQRH